MNEYPHMCRDGHIEIGHKDSQYEQCPMCRALYAIELALNADETSPSQYFKDKAEAERILKDLRS